MDTQKIQRNLYSTKLENEKKRQLSGQVPHSKVKSRPNRQFKQIYKPLRKQEQSLNVYATKKPRARRFSLEFYQNFKEELVPLLLRLFHIIKTEGTLLNSFYEVTVTLIPKPQKNATKKQNCKSIFLMNIDVKLHKMQAN